MNRYSVTVSITLEIDAESESDAKRMAFDKVNGDCGAAGEGVSAIWIDSVGKCEEGK